MLRIASALLFLGAVAYAGEPRVGDVIAGKVARVYDGDTFWIELPDVAHRIRLHGADAPEMERKGFWPTQPGAVEALNWLASQIDGKTVRCKVKGKSYGRFVCDVTVGERDVAIGLLERGLAWSDPRYATTPQKEAERRARSANLGVWAKGKQSVAPWAWRKGSR